MLIEKSVNGDFFNFYILSIIFATSQGFSNIIRSAIKKSRSLFRRAEKEALIIFLNLNRSYFVLPRIKTIFYKTKILWAISFIIVDSIERKSVFKFFSRFNITIPDPIDLIFPIITKFNKILLGEGYLSFIVSIRISFAINTIFHILKFAYQAVAQFFIFKIKLLPQDTTSWDIIFLPKAVINFRPRPVQLLSYFFESHILLPIQIIKFRLFVHNSLPDCLSCNYIIWVNDKSFKYEVDYA